MTGEKKRTLILLALLIVGLVFLWLINHGVDTNFVNQL